jgi:hypothetical protein
LDSKPAVPAYVEAERGAADQDRVVEDGSGAFDVLDDVDAAPPAEQVADWADEVGVSVATGSGDGGVAGAGRRRGDDVEGVEPRGLGQDVHRVGDDQLERVVGMVFDVDAGEVEPGPVVADGGAAGTAEQVEESGPGHGSMRRRSSASVCR